MAGTYYFASDFHLGAPNKESSFEREKRVVAWLDEIKSNVTELFILGDVFDFWFEYKTVVPRGYVRLLGKLAEISDAGIPIHLFIGNHDMNGKKVYIGHGDGLGPGDHGYKFIKKVFRAPLSQWLFARFHPNFGIGLANYFSSSSRKTSQESDKVFLGKENEWLAIYCEEISAKEDVDYFVFGHRHLPMRLKLDNGGEYLNIGDWITHFTYGKLDENGFALKGYGTNPTIYSNTELNQ